MIEPEIVFALARGQNVFFLELAEAFRFELGLLGVSSRVVEGELPTARKGAVTVLLPPHEFATLSGLELTPGVLSRCVLISAEQPATPFFGSNAHLGRDAGAVLDINRRGVRAYRALGIEAEHLQLGYSRAWDGRDQACERDIDLLFLGRVTERRERALAVYADVLERFNCEIILSDNASPNTGGGASFAAMESKHGLLARSKVLLNIHGEDEPYFEWLRVVEAMSCGCAVVSEHSTDIEPLQAGADLMTGSLGSLGYLAAWLLDDDDRRAAIASSGETRLRAEAPLSQAAARLRDVARRVDAVPLDPEAEVETKVARAKLTLSPPPSRKVPLPPSDGTSLTERRILRALKRHQGELASLRRRFAAEQLARLRPRDPEPHTHEDLTTPAWRERSRPIASVVIPMYNAAETVLEALDSVAGSTMRSWEIVVVNDGSADGGGEMVREWAERHPNQRLGLFRHEVNRGLPPSRNTGMKRARGDLLLMLDADNRVRPFGISRLVTALVKDPGADFAYGLLDRFELGGPLGLISKFGWEPARLRSGNYIDALAMIRRRALFEMDGYTEDPRLMGVEDYDLWARMAEDGRRGAFVRQIVAEYRVGHTSMISDVGVSMTDAVAAISEHAPTLMEGVDVSAC
jgi:hypothetical protein